MTSKSNLKKTAQSLIMIAEEFEGTHPEIAQQADECLKDLVREAQMTDFAMMEKEGDPEEEMESQSLDITDLFNQIGSEEESSELPLDSESSEHDHSESLEHDHSESLEHDHSESLEHDIGSIEIEEVEELKEELEEMGIEDLDDLIQNMSRHPIAFRKNKEALIDILTDAKKSKDYHDAARTRRDKANSGFEAAGLKMKLKDFD